MCFEHSYKTQPYKSNEAEAYTTAINILAVEYLIKTNDREEYERRCEQLSDLSEDYLSVLHIWLSLNMHTSSLGAMITQGDYNYQRNSLLMFLNDPDFCYTFGYPNDELKGD